MKIFEILYSKLFSRPGNLGRLIWPSREEIDYLKNLPKNIFKSKIFWIGIGIFILYLISDALAKAFIPKDRLYPSFFSGIYFTNLYHTAHPLITSLGLLFVIRALLFLRFKTWWRTNKFLDIGFGVVLGTILARIKDIQGAIDWIQIGQEGYVINLIDVFVFLGMLFLIVGVIICPKMHYKKV